MDWSKAKTILIVALLLTNFLLGYVIFFKQDMVDATTDGEFIENTIKLLKEKNIELATTIPVETEDLFGLVVEYEIQDPVNLNNNFFDGNGSIDVKGEGLQEIKYLDKTITILNDKLIIYEANPRGEIYSIESEEEAEDIARGFLNENGISTSDMEISFVKKSGNSYNIEFTKVFNSHYIESTFTNLQLNNRGVIKMERNWLNMKEIGITPIEISSAPKSILSLLSKKEVYGKTISHISLCYYFDPKMQVYQFDPEETQQGTTIPAWRVQFEDGYKVIIDNY
ncbi:hypothetical protein E9840_10630 [Tissierella creatinini]|nr:hypothetical protein E9840_10630 [Tissierella creatinini]TJX61929.1 hypothetical protein E8P77_17725 [Soehngenia saccharolytica]